MQLFKRALCFCLVLMMVAGLSLSGHALGYVLNGTVTSYGAEDAQTTLYLISDDEVGVEWEQSVSGNSTNYRLAGIRPGNYTLTAEKDGHVTRSYPVTIDGSDVVLDVKICLRGDANCNGKVNIGDVSVTYAHAKRSVLITDSYKLACADLTGDGRVNLGDTSRIYAVTRDSYKPPVKEVTLTVWTPSNDQEGDYSWLYQMETNFQKAHPEYSITWNNVICHEGDAGWYITEDPENAGDVYMFSNDQLGNLVESGAIQKLTGSYLDQVLADNSQTMINTVTYTDNNVYGFPMTNNTWFMYYNKNIFSEEDVKSLDTMLTKGRVAFPWSTAWYSGTFFLANGGTIFGEKGLDASAGIQFGKNNGGYEAALKMIELAANPNMVDDANGMGFSGFIDGTVGAYFSGSWDYGSLCEYLGDKLGVVQLPTVEIGGQQKQMKAFAGSKAVASNPHADNPELAMAFAAYLATADAQKLRYEYYGVIPAATSLAKDPVIRMDPVAVAEINNIKNASVLQPYLPQMANYWTPIGDFGAMVASGAINKDNYREFVDILLAQLNETDDDDSGDDNDAVVLQIWAPYEDQVEDGWLETMQDRFAAEHPETDIIWENIVCYSGDVISFVRDDPSNAADVYLVANDQIGMLREDGMILKLTGEERDQVLADNTQTLIDTVTQSDGGIYGFPMTGNTWFMYYDKQIFSEEDVKSLDTMLTKGRVAFPWNTAWYSGTFFLANGGTLFGESGNDASAGIQFGEANGGYEAALKMIQLAKNPNFLEDADGFGYTGFMNGYLAAFFSGSWDYESLYERLGDNLGAVQLPTVEIGGVQKQMKSFAGSTVAGVNPNSRYVDLATAFAAYIATPESQKLRYELSGVIPAAASLSNDPLIRQNPVAAAQIDTLNNTAVVQPTVTEMASYWSPMGTFGSCILSGDIHEGNYQQAVDQLMFAFGNDDLPGEDFLITNIVSSTDGVEGGVTLRIHYHRPDGNYTDWNLWLWDSVSIENTVLIPPYQFEWVDGEMVCTVTVPSYINEVGYLVRLGDWIDKDIMDDQFIDLTGILCGTVDIYIESGIRGHEIVLNDDVVLGIAVTTLDYKPNKQQLIIGVTSALGADPSVALYDSYGSVEITGIAKVGSYYYLTLETPLVADSYYLELDTITVTFDLI